MGTPFNTWWHRNPFHTINFIYIIQLSLRRRQFPNTRFITTNIWLHESVNWWKSANWMERQYWVRNLFYAQELLPSSSILTKIWFRIANHCCIVKYNLICHPEPLYSDRLFNKFWFLLWDKKLESQHKHFSKHWLFTVHDNKADGWRLTYIRHCFYCTLFIDLNVNTLTGNQILSRNWVTESRRRVLGLFDN